MKKFLAVALALLMIIVTFASCGSTPDIVDESESQSDEIINEPVIPTPTPDGGAADGADDEADDGSDEGEDKKDEEPADTCDHQEGTQATCIAQSICSVCKKPYGDKDPGRHASTETKWIVTATAHKMVYSCCEAVVNNSEQAHDFSSGTCICGATEEDVACAHETKDEYGHSCKSCNKFFKHVYENNVCKVCGLEKNGKTVKFGSYPQSKVTDSSTISALNAKAGTAGASASGWISYGYYNNADMCYVDVEEGGAKYRGVYFTSYRPNNFDSSTLQATNGYTSGTVYWFKYEPINWTVLEEANGKALILCNMIIDAQEFDSMNDSDANNSYAESTIRKWLNDTFCKTSFSELQKAVILTTAVDNDGESTGYNPPAYSSNDTNDKVFLLSRVDVKNAAYGFNTDGAVTGSNSGRQKYATDYAKVQGASASSSNGNNWWWWIRTAAPCNSNMTNYDNKYAHHIAANGGVTSGSVYTASGGVVPAMWVYINN